MRRVRLTFTTCWRRDRFTTLSSSSRSGFGRSSSGEGGLIGVTGSVDPLLNRGRVAGDDVSATLICLETYTFRSPSLSEALSIPKAALAFLAKSEPDRDKIGGEVARILFGTQSSLNHSGIALRRGDGESLRTFS